MPSGTSKDQRIKEPSPDALITYIVMNIMQKKIGNWTATLRFFFTKAKKKHPLLAASVATAGIRKGRSFVAILTMIRMIDSMAVTILTKVSAFMFDV